MKTLSKLIAICLIIACLVLLVSTIVTCIIYPLEIWHKIVVISFVLAVVLWLISWAVDLLLYLFTGKGLIG